MNRISGTANSEGILTSSPPDWRFTAEIAPDRPHCSVSQALFLNQRGTLSKIHKETKTTFNKNTYLKKASHKILAKNDSSYLDLEHPGATRPVMVTD